MRDVFVNGKQQKQNWFGKHKHRNQQMFKGNEKANDHRQSSGCAPKDTRIHIFVHTLQEIGASADTFTENYIY